MNEPTFESFPKMARLRRDIIVTEKIDGTNAQILITPATVVQGELVPDPYRLAWWAGPDGSCWNMYAGSRNRFVTPGADNYGFAGWVLENHEDLKALGPGRHFGEWWGRGINRGYGMECRCFSLFNVARWDNQLHDWLEVQKSKRNPTYQMTPFSEPPCCCRTVPILYVGEFDSSSVAHTLEFLRSKGSEAAPGFMRPEGVVVYHTAAGICFKRTFEHDEAGKGAQ